MITREADYAIRVLMRLARQDEGADGCVPSIRIAEEMGIPHRFLRKLVKRMVAAGLLRSRRGKSGGLMLGRKGARVSLFEVLQTMSPTGTRLSWCESAGNTCQRKRDCGMNRVIHRIQTGVDRQLRTTTIAALVS